MDIVVWMVVLGHATLQILGLANVTPTGRLTYEHINIIGQSPRAGLEPAT